MSDDSTRSIPPRTTVSSLRTRIIDSNLLLVVGGVVLAYALGRRDAAGDLALPLAAVQILWINLLTDGLPTAHFEGPELYLLYPPDPRTEEATMREAMLCRREGITINIFGAGAAKTGDSSILAVDLSVISARDYTAVASLTD